MNKRNSIAYKFLKKLDNLFKKRYSKEYIHDCQYTNDYGDIS